MTKYFVGTGDQEPASYNMHNEIVRYGVHVEHDSKRYSLTRNVGGLDTEYQWDGGGPDSTDLARGLLLEVTGVAPEWRVYRLFKSEVVAIWPRRAGECWRISDEEIRQWLAGVERDTAKTEEPSRADALQEQMRGRELRLHGFAQTRNRKT